MAETVYATELVRRPFRLKSSAYTTAAPGYRFEFSGLKSVVSAPGATFDRSVLDGAFRVDVEINDEGQVTSVVPSVIPKRDLGMYARMTPEEREEYHLDMGNIGIPEGVTPVRCEHGVNTWFGHECGLCG